MTLALHGKSKRRKLALITGALAVLTLAGAGGMVLHQDARAADDRVITICKVLETDGDALNDSGTFTFEFDYPEGVPQQVVEVTATEGGSSSCKNLSVPSSATVYVSEVGTPAGWNGDAAGYPKWDIHGDVGTATNREVPTTGNTTINVTKIERGATSGDSSGWSITVSGCGIQPQTKTTAADGTVNFTGLPVCDAYTVSEDTASKPWFIAMTPSSVQVVARVPGQTYYAAFENLFTPPTGCVGCIPPIATTPAETPTSTATATATTVPTTVTAVPTTATATVVPPTGTITEVVLGEKTPAPGAGTPAAPQTGSGTDAGWSSANPLLIAMGIAATTLGLGVLAVSRRRSR